MGNSNTFRKTRRYPYRQDAIEHNLQQNFNLHEIRLRVTGLVTIAGGAANGAVVEDGPARLLRSLLTRHDGIDIVAAELGGRDFLHFTRRSFAQVVAVTTLASAAVQANTPIRADVVIPLSWKFFANPYDVFWAAQRVEQELKSFIQFETAATNATSAPGSAAIVTGGDRAVTFTNLQVQVTELCSASDVKPQYMPIFTCRNSDQFLAANAELNYQLTTKRAVAAYLLMMRQGVTQDSQDGINVVTLVGGLTRRIDAIGYDDLKSEERNLFPAVGVADGTVLLPFCDNGKVTQALVPAREGTDPRLIFDVDAPSVNPGFIRVMGLELAVKTGVTQRSEL